MPGERDVALVPQQVEDVYRLDEGAFGTVKTKARSWTQPEAPRYAGIAARIVRGQRALGRTPPVVASWLGEDALVTQASHIAPQ
jgi:hypothetical protein